MRGFLLALVVLLLGVVVGCAPVQSNAKVNYRTATGASGGDSDSAQAHFEEAINLLCVNNICDAEQALHQALICDDTFGPAHNALGKIYFDQKKFYLAAWEFEHANRLMPSRPEPVNNLGLVYESVGHFDKATDWFIQAHAMDDSNPEYLGNLIRARMRRGDDSPEIYLMLERLTLIDDRPEWRNWARTQLTLRRVDDSEDAERLRVGGDSRNSQNLPELITPAELETTPRSIIRPIDEMQ